MKFTKKKWTFKEQGDANNYVVFAGDNWLLHIQHNGEQVNNEQLANLRLICGAKDILKSLNEMIEMYEKVQPAGGYQGVYETAKMRVNKILDK